MPSGRLRRYIIGGGIALAAAVAPAVPASAVTPVIEVTPAAAWHPAKTGQNFTIVIRDAETGEGIQGARLWLQISGANPRGPFVITSSNGGVTGVGYVGDEAGEDVITVCHDADSDGEFCEPDEAKGTATKTWVPLVSAGRMVSNATRNGAKFASHVDCDAAVANARSRPFVIQSGTNMFRMTSVNRVSCYDNPDFTPSPAPATMAFDTQTGFATGTWNGLPGYTLEWTLEDHGAPSASDAARLIVRDPTQRPVLNVQLGTLSGGQNYALPPS